MAKQIILITLLVLRIAYSSLTNNAVSAPFTSYTTDHPTLNSGAVPGFLSVTGSIQQNKIVLDWEVQENRLADQFEVEKSADGKNFTMAALVFGTDNDSLNHYQFYENAGSDIRIFRIRLINKNKTSVYSREVTIYPPTEF
jgi:hypothetical protein